MVEKFDKIGTALLYGIVYTPEIEGGKIRRVDILIDDIQITHIFPFSKIHGLRDIAYSF